MGFVVSVVIFVLEVGEKFSYVGLVEVLIEFGIDVCLFGKFNVRFYRCLGVVLV